MSRYEEASNILAQIEREKSDEKQHMGDKIFNQISIKQSEKSIVDEFLEEVATHSPNGRIATPEEVAALVLFLAGNDASHITGTAMSIDGGYSEDEVKIEDDVHVGNSFSRMQTPGTGDDSQL